MTIFRSSITVLAIFFSMPGFADAGQSPARNHVEEMLLLNVDAAKQKLESWVVANRGKEAVIAQDLLGAGFVPDKGSPQCRFYTYYRKTGLAGSARTSSVALCDAPLDPMVLVLDFLPEQKRKSASKLMENKVQK